MLIEKIKKHKRMKEKYNPNPNKKQKDYWSFVAQAGCLVCGKEASIHHVISDGYKRLSKGHWHVTPLCYEHHQGDKGYHGLGSHNAFKDMYGIDLHKAGIELREMYEIAKESQ
jgi:hypothetical protein